MRFCGLLESVNIREFLLFTFVIYKSKLSVNSLPVTIEKSVFLCDFYHFASKLFDPDGVIDLSGGLVFTKIRPRWGPSKQSESEKRERFTPL